MASSEEPSNVAMLGGTIGGAVIWYFSKWWIGLIVFLIIGGGMFALEDSGKGEISIFICGALGGIAAWYFLTWWAGLIVFFLLLGICSEIANKSSSALLDKLPSNGRFNPRSGEWE